MPPIKPINFSFRKLEHIREITILTHISKHSFESIPDNVRKLVLLCSNKYGSPDMSKCKFPKYLTYIEFQELDVHELPWLNKCYYLEEIQFLGVRTIVKKNINLRANLLFWKAIPRNVRKLSFGYHEESLFDYKSMTDVYIEDNLEGVNIEVTYDKIGLVFLSKKTFSSQSKFLENKKPHMRFFNDSHKVTMNINEDTMGVLYSDKNFNFSNFHFQDLDKFPFNPLKN
ncbi:unnamed protein product [Ambrosiozyma monospora]|uniref:Unnamed protein product n=1 Tax=Ambrosiozyma monospora TaxID=43982 RepID=A0ACB5TNJ8_AMBMO|nr:unnamed protein product [Ambrosiozyma monospora]